MCPPLFGCWQAGKRLARLRLTLLLRNLHLCRLRHQRCISDLCLAEEELHVEVQLSAPLPSAPSLVAPLSPIARHQARHTSNGSPHHRVCQTAKRLGPLSLSHGLDRSSSNLLASCLRHRLLVCLFQRELLPKLLSCYCSAL